MFGGLGSLEGVLNTETTRDIYMHTACHIYMYSASRAYHSALAQVVLPAYFIAPVKIHTELEKVLLIHVTVC